MTSIAQTRMTLPTEREVQAAVQGQRASKRNTSRSLMTETKATGGFDAVQRMQRFNWFCHPNYWSDSTEFNPNDAELSCHQRNVRL